FLLMSHASGAVDALFSRGLANTTEIVNAAAPALLRALAEDDFSLDRFEPVDRLQQALLDHNDRLVASSYTAFRDFALWNAWYRIWVVGTFYGWLRLNRFHSLWEKTQQEGVFAGLLAQRWPGYLCPGFAPFAALFDAAADLLERVEAGALSPAQATAGLLALLGEARFVPPPFEIGDPRRRHTLEGDAATFQELLAWFKHAAPPEAQALLFG
ncbi:MAG TPA: FAD-dependent oxidoreductase, partial [Thermoanaerobaculia bacterium]|nr:FAD-dependent oxidoreductase [Thermoanaerobaculia bacterium]